MINGKIHVSDDKYNRVLNAIEQLSFNPSFFATNLKSNQQRMIGFVVPELSAVHMEILSGMIDKLEDRGFSVVVKTTRHQLINEEFILQELRNMRVMGIFISTCDGRNPERFLRYAGQGTTLVFIDSYIENPRFSYIKFANVQAIHLAATNLIRKLREQNARNPASEITLLVGNEDYLNENDCVEGFISAFPSNSACRIIRVRQNRELGFIELVEKLPSRATVPKYFIASSQALAEAARMLLKFHSMDAGVFFLSGEAWSADEDTPENGIQRIVPIRRCAVQLGDAAAKIMLGHLSKPLFYESKQVTVETYRAEKEAVAKAMAPAAYHSKKLRICMLNGTQSGSLLKLTKAYSETFSIDIEIEKLSYGDLYERIKKNDSGTDMFMIDYLWFDQLSNDRYLLPMDEYLSEDDDGFLRNFYSAVLPTFIKYTGHIYTLPFLVTMQALFYRKDLFEDSDLRRYFFKEYGVTLSPPKNWTEFLLVAKFFTKKYNPRSSVTYGTSFPGLSTIALVQEFLPRQYAYKGSLYSRDGKVMIASPANYRALSNLCELYAYTPGNELSISENYVSTEERRILNNEIAMYFTFATHIPMPSVDNEFPVDFSNISIAPMPGAMLGGWNIGISAAADSPRECYRFIKWVTSDQRAIQATLLGSIVPKNIIFQTLECKKTNPSLDFLQKELGNAVRRESITRVGRKDVSFRDIDGILADGIRRAITGEMSAEETLSHLEKRLNSLQDIASLSVPL